MSDTKPENTCTAPGLCADLTQTPPAGADRKPKAAAATKTAQLIRMLRRKHGADLPTLSSRLGWLPHTTRAALSRLRKAGHNLTCEKSDDGKPSRYRIHDLPTGESQM